MQDETVVITNHAYDMAKERAGWNKCTLDKMALKAYCEGLNHTNAKGGLHKWLTKIFFAHNMKANNNRIYGEFVFLFNGNVLITIYQIPINLRKVVKKIKTIQCLKQS